MVIILFSANDEEIHCNQNINYNNNILKHQLQQKHYYDNRSNDGNTDQS